MLKYNKIGAAYVIPSEIAKTRRNNVFRGKQRISKVFPMKLKSFDMKTYAPLKFSYPKGRMKGK